MEKNKIALILLILAVTAFILRWYLMPGNLFFGPEQGRDFLVIKDIVENNKLTLIGSKTDVAGIFHGPVYYYLAAIPFSMSRGDPVTVLAFFTIIQIACIYLVYLLIHELTNRKRAGLIGAAVFSVSFLFIVYSRWLSNPPLSIPLSLLFMVCMLRFIRGKSIYLVISAVIFGLLGQVEFINFLLFGGIGICIVLVYHRRFIKTGPLILIVSAIAGFITSLATYIFFDIRHNSIVRNGVLDLLSGKSSYHVTFLVSTLGAFRVLMEQVTLIFGLTGWIPGAILTVFLLGIVFMLMKRDKAYGLVLLWVIVPPVLFALLRHGMLEQLYAGIIGAFVIVIGLSIDWIWEKKVIAGQIVLFLFVALNVIAVVRNLPDNDHVFFQPQQPGVRYSDQLAVIDWIYADAEATRYSFQSYTIPYFLQDAWTYLFGYYGNWTYGYVPDDQGRKVMYLVVQKDTIDPGFQKKWHKDITATLGTLTKSKQIGDYTIEEWTL